VAEWVLIRKQLREVTHRFIVDASSGCEAMDEAAAQYAAGEGREVCDEPAADSQWAIERAEEG
jgi:hypothetical protein